MKLPLSLNRLGMWNRLALVLSVLAVAVVPAVEYERYLQDAYESREFIFKQCRRANAGTGANDLSGWMKRDEHCMDELTRPVVPPSSSFYWELTYSTALGCLILYLLIWGIVSTAKWIWRGRKAA